jgi:tetratricopeptide (TPR) repeat protein
MTSREKGLLAGLVALFFMAGCLAVGWWVATPTPVQRPAPSVARRLAPQSVLRHAVDPFSKDIKTFVAAVREAEKQTDPLQRCLAYPDPPGSHWNHDAVVAYCHYRLQTTISFAEVKQLIEQDRSAELDRRMDEALQAQFSQPYAKGALDHIFINDFSDGSFAMRELLDAWKRGSPDSAYAYAASGYAYVLMAHEQRGGGWAKDTPQEKFDAMDRLLRQARADLQHAIQLNPRITPVYVAMMHAAALTGDTGYADQAIRAGLKVDPSDWFIYDEMMWLERPEWFGSFERMQHVADLAIKHANANPLLWMEKQSVARYRANFSNCGCAPHPMAFNFPAALDELANGTMLAAAGKKAAEQGASPMAVVYLSEAIRFHGTGDELRQMRAEHLVFVGEPEMALQEANELVAQEPGDARNYVTRGDVYIDSGDTLRGVKDLETALAMNPDDDQVLEMLGNVYTNRTHDWDKAWDIANRFIRKYPESPGGWVMRATIQETQPRAGLEDTYQYFLTHFGNDPSMKWQIDRMREVLAKRPRSDTAAVSPNH